MWDAVESVLRRSGEVEYGAWKLNAETARCYLRAAVVEVPPPPPTSLLRSAPPAYVIFMTKERRNILVTFWGCQPAVLKSTEVEPGPVLETDAYSRM